MKEIINVFEDGCTAQLSINRREYDMYNSFGALIGTARHDCPFIIQAQVSGVYLTYRDMQTLPIVVELAQSELNNNFMIQYEPQVVGRGEFPPRERYTCPIPSTPKI